MIWRVRDRRTFKELRRHGKRARKGPLMVVFLADPPQTRAAPPRVAYAVNKKVGNAVTRNRLRRRLGAILREIHGTVDTALPPGVYLLVPMPESTTLSRVELKKVAQAVLARVTRP